MSTRRQLSWRARRSSQRIREGSRRAAVTCWGDFANPRLIPIKFAFFIIMGATQCVAPFGTLLLRALGLNLQEVGLIFTIGPLIPIFAPLLAGVIADKVGNFRSILVFTVALSGLVALINLTIPPARTNPNYSENLTVSLTCSKDQENFVLTPNKKMKEEDKCVFYNKTVIVPAVDARECGYICQDPVFVYPAAVMRKLRKAKIVFSVNSTLFHICELHDSRKSNRAQKCYRNNKHELFQHEDMPRTFSLHNLVIHLEKMTPSKVNLPIETFSMSTEHGQKFDCKDGDVPKEVYIPKLEISDTSSELEASQVKSSKCRFHCNVDIPHNQTCEENPLSIEHNVALSFWLFVTVKLLMKFLIGLSYTLFEVAVVAILKEFGHDYGLQRIYGSIGGMVFAPLSGLFIDLFKSQEEESYTDYYVIFIFYCGLKVLCGLLLVKLDLKFKAPAKSITENISNIFTSIEVLFLLFIVFISGMCYGFIENFLPWHLREYLEAPNWFIGILTTVASVAALPFLAFSGAICKKFGNIQSISFGLVCYAIRCVGYSMIQDYYWCIPFEILEGITTGLLVAAAITYGSQLSTKTNVATLQGLLATFHYGLGKSAGSLVGGYLMSTLGASFAFQAFSGIAFTCGFCYYLLGKLFILPRQAKQLRRRREVMAMPVETISTEEHKRMSQVLNSLPPVDYETHGKKSRKREKSPTKDVENGHKQDIENEILDETQMTDLTENDSMLSLDDPYDLQNETRRETNKTDTENGQL